jgi:hypothetical protein
MSTRLAKIRFIAAANMRPLAETGGSRCLSHGARETVLADGILLVAIEVQTSDTDGYVPVLLEAGIVVGKRLVSSSASRQGQVVHLNCLPKAGAPLVLELAPLPKGYRRNVPNAEVIRIERRVHRWRANRHRSARRTDRTQCRLELRTARPKPKRFEKGCGAALAAWLTLSR